MLKTLDYSVTFPTTGRTLSGQFAFQTGFGAIVGPNEAGKSFILEMIRFCLFGTAALRGAATDYKTLKAELAFEVRGETYTAKRSITNAKLLRGAEIICTGVKGVNTKVAEILGFGLTVFDVACAANQGNIEKLGAMRPTERKQMVDSVIGLSVIDDLTDWCGKEALGLNRLVEGLEQNLVEPVAPVAPPRIVTQAELEPLRELRSELHRLEGWLSIDRPTPTAPVQEVVATIDQLEDLLAIARDAEAAKAEINKLPQAPADLGENDHDAWELWQERLAWERNHPVSLTRGQLAQAKTAFDLSMRFDAVDLARRKLAQHDDHHCCPACQHTWPTEPDLYAKLKARVEVAEAGVAGEERPEHVVDQGIIALAERQLLAFERDATDWERLKDVPEATKPRFTRQQLATFTDAALRLPELRRRATQPAGDAKVLQASIRKVHAYEAAVEAHERAVAEHEAWRADRAVKAARAAELAPLVAPLPELERDLVLSIQYAELAKEFEKHMFRYLAAKAESEAKALEADGYRRGKAALILLRRLVKQHLVPSLNKVASKLIHQMTGGERREVLVDDEFNILVDNQPLDTLSGSGKAVANLALRLGLGQVLTNGQFSVFLGDEIDASMDQDRAKNTALALEYLAEKVSQILLVTHKYPPADYYIALGKNAEQAD